MLLISGLLTAAAGAQTTPLVLGVGPIVHRFDGTDEALWLARYLREHPIVLDGRPVEVRLVEHPADADYALFGSVDGEMRSTWSAGDQRRGGLRLGLATGLIVAPVTVGGIAWYAGLRPDDRLGPAVYGGCVGSVALAFLLGNLPIQRWRWHQEAHLELYGPGGKIPLEATDEGRRARYAKPPDHARAMMVDGLWAEVRTETEAAIEAGGATDGAR